MSLVYLERRNVKKLIKLGNIDEENLHIFQTTRRISLMFSRKMCLMIMFKVTKKQRLYPLYRKYSFRKTSGGVKLTPSLLRANKMFVDP